MKKANNNKNIFIDYYPKIDLHGMDRYSAVFEVKRFINECVIMKRDKLVIVHGKGSLILMKEIHKYLKTNKIVISYKLDYFNTGCTVVSINLNAK